MIVWSLTGLKNTQRSLWFYLHTYVIAEVGYHTLVSVKNNTRASRTVFHCVPALASAQYVLINQKYFWTHSHANHRLYWLVLYFLICLSVSNLDVRFAQGRSADLCPQMTQLPWIHSWFSHRYNVLPPAWVRPVNLTLNNRIILTAWGWTAVVTNELSSTTLLS